MVLAAGAGTRLLPLTERTPKALCPVGDRTLLDHALDALREALGAEEPGTLAVNSHHHAGMLAEHVARNWPGVHVEREQPEALGTAGAIGNLRRWLAGRPVLVTNADTIHDADLRAFVRAWDRERVAVLSTGVDFGPSSSVIASVLPATVAASLSTEPSGLWEVVWRRESDAGRLQVVAQAARIIDCGTPRRYLDANLAWLDGSDGWVHPTAEASGRVVESVVGAGAVVRGSVRRSVVWPRSVVDGGEQLVGSIRTVDSTVVVA